MRRKTFTAPAVLKEAQKGAFEAIFSRFNVIDHDQEVVLPGAIQDGAEVRISYWGHRWQDLPVGRGTVRTDAEKAIVHGQLFLSTAGGRETYETLKGLGELAEFSYGFDVLDSEPGTFQGQHVTFLKKLRLYEVSPVFLAATPNTSLQSIKSAGAARLTGSPWEAMREIALLWPLSPSPLAASRYGPSNVRRRLDEDLEALTGAELAALQAAFKAKGGPSTLDARRSGLLAGGHSPAWVDAMLEIEAGRLAWQLEQENPVAAEANPGWARAEALRLLQAPAR